jgi:hypothetical protein
MDCIQGDAMNGVLFTNLRDKIILGAMIFTETLAFVTLWVLLGKEKIDVAIIMAIVGIIVSIVTGLFGIYKGLPSLPTESKTSETTVSYTVPPKP